MEEKQNELRVDVEEIMRGIREKIAAEERTARTAFEDIPVFLPREVIPCPDVPDGSESEAALQALRRSWTVEYYWPFEGNRLKVLLKRIVRKLLKCLLPPIMMKQNELNGNIVRCLSYDRRRAEVLEQRLAETEKRLAELTARTEWLEQRNRELAAQRKSSAGD